MRHDLFLFKKRLHAIIFILCLFFLFMPLKLSGQSLSGDRLSEVKDQSLNESESRVSYQNILKQSGKEYLWFNRNGLTLSGRTLHWLLADLGWHQTLNINALAKEHYRLHDRLLSNGFLVLLTADNQKNSSPDSLPDMELRLIQAVKSDATEALLFSLIPEYEQINQLRKAISHYRLLSVSPWPTLDPNFRPKLGQSHPKVAGIRDILRRLGYLARKAQQKYRRDIFDSVAIDALKKFQRNHGLAADGELGGQTYMALQVTPEQRIKQLQVNLWRWFSLPNHPPEKYVVVNIPSYQLAVIEGGMPVLAMKVIVGNSKNPTPQLLTEINRLTLNPSWTPTLNIIKNELIPEYQSDFLSLKRRNFQLLTGYWENIQRREIDQPEMNLQQLLQSYRLVQAPGANNALGYYRFNIPNTESIYLHDTPLKSLFKQRFRALSHGCVRLENASLLAKYLLTFEGEQNENKMFSAIQSGKTTHIQLTNPLPVYITYQTAWIDSQGELRWSADIYSLDNKMM